VQKLARYGVTIGRFQPVHYGHLSIIERALEQVDELIIVIGSASSARTIRNPWTADERIDMIKSVLRTEDRDRVKFVKANDRLYNDNLWLVSVQSKIADVTDGSDDIVLFGHQKDDTSFYLKLFPQWKFIAVPYVKGIDATKVREMYFKCDLLDMQRYVPLNVYETLKSNMMASAVTLNETFKELKDEFEHIASYRDMWNGAPFPPTFVTVDAVVVRSGHVLMVRRKGMPGRGLIALPGGFINQRETLLTSCLRELREETSIKVTREELEAALVDKKEFDHPDRSLRGRTITHAYCFSLGHGPLPRVKGGDDAGKAWWMPLNDVMANEDRFFEDHFHIISHFVNKF